MTNIYFEVREDAIAPEKHSSLIKYRQWDVKFSTGVVLHNKLNLHRLILPHKAFQTASKRPQIIQSCVSHRLNSKVMSEPMKLKYCKMD